MSSLTMRTRMRTGIGMRMSSPAHWIILRIWALRVARRREGGVRDRISINNNNNNTRGTRMEGTVNTSSRGMWCFRRRRRC